jgi:hypothetical protein
MLSIASRRFLQTGWPIPQLDWPIFNRSLYRDGCPQDAMPEPRDEIIVEGSTRP